MSKVQSNEIANVPAIPNQPGSKTVLAESKIFSKWDADSLIEFNIKRFHFDTRKNIVAIYDLAQKVSHKHSDKHPELCKLTTSLFLFFDDLLFRLRKEEQMLIPGIRQLYEKESRSHSGAYSTFGVIKESALAMQNEHQAVVKQLEFLRQLTDNYHIPGDACRLYKKLFGNMQQFEKDLLLHIDLEKNILFPKTIQKD